MPARAAVRQRAFADRLVAWQRAHGRHDLPWQQRRDAYAVWLSEIMLQQTQVATVRDYFARFIARFPQVRDLAAASQDEVLALWSGLGYYSRARHLHRCAQQVVQQHGGEFPRTAEALQRLPGIGPSTAAAIASFCFGQRISILDGNVRRVLTRWLGFDDDLALAASERALWQRAQDLLPTPAQVQRDAGAMPAYTQGLMDLGATLCTPRKPRCDACPMRADCVAHARGTPEAWPVRTRKLKRSAQSLWLLWLCSPAGEVWLARRPARGVWAGLHCLPAFESRDALDEALPASLRSQAVDEPAFLHVLTHRDLHLHPVRVVWSLRRAPSMEGQWVARDALAAVGLPAPVRRLLQG
ncbi:MAG: A/G-specific adenine glycosylase [Burkholderiaceae bacterium]